MEGKERMERGVWGLARGWKGFWREWECREAPELAFLCERESERERVLGRKGLAVKSTGEGFILFGINIFVGIIS